MTTSSAAHGPQADVDEVQPHAETAKRVRRPRDMALSLGVLLIPIVLIVLVGRFLYGGSTTTTVDPELALKGAARAGMRPIPAGTAPPGWKIVSARYADGVLRIGYVDPSDQGAQLVQGTSANLITAELTGRARQTGSTTAGGQSWQVWSGREGESALVRQDGPTTIVVVGAVGPAELSLLATTVTG